MAGGARVAGALPLLPAGRGWPTRGVGTRPPDPAARLAQQVGAAAWPEPGQLAQALLVLLTAPAGAIAPCCQAVAQAGGWRSGQGVAHCSGAVEVTALAPAQVAGAVIGGFHPLQAFATVEAALAVLPGSFFALEGAGLLRDWLPALAATLDGTWQWLAPGARPLYHAGAVFASNYVVTLFSVGVNLLTQAGLTPTQASAALLSLTQGAVRNLAAVGLPAALTGPIRRGDVETVVRHLAALEAAAPALSNLYRSLAQQTLPLAQALDLDPQALDALKQVMMPCTSNAAS